MPTIKEIIEGNPGYNHITVTGDNDTIIIVVDNEGNVRCLLSKEYRFNIQNRAIFSLDPTISNASGNKDALEIQLTARGSVFEDWKEAYAIEVARKLHGMTEFKVSTTNNPLRDNELEVEFDRPSAPEDIDNATHDEDEAIGNDKSTMGFTDEDMSIIGVQEDEPFDPETDEQKFISLACGTGRSLQDIITGYSSGFYISNLLDTIIDLREHGHITLNELVHTDQGIQYGESVEFKTEEAEDPSLAEDDIPVSGSLSILDNENGNDDEYVQELFQYVTPDIPYARTPAMTNGSYHDDNDSESLPPLPDNEDIPSTSGILSNDDTGSTLDDTDNTDNEPHYDVPSIQPVEYPEHFNEDQPETEDELTVDMVEDTNENDTQNIDEDIASTVDTNEEDNATVQQSPNEEAVVDDHGDASDTEIDNLVSFVGKAKTKLDDLKTRKDKVDDIIDQLHSIDPDEITSLIESYEEDKHDLERKIAELREQKADVIKNIKDAQTQKAQQDEQLSHLDEYTAQSNHLGEQIESLETALGL